MKSNKYTYISLFSSSGVGCYGFHQKGFECAATNELLERRMKVQKNNIKCKSEECYVTGDILKEETITAIMKLVEKHKVKSKRPIDFLLATPPCQGISLANHKKTKSDKKRNSLVVESIKLTQLIKPRVFIYENVRGFLNTLCSDLDGYDKLISESINENLGGEYFISSRIVNFKHYGVPSSRTRTLVIGVRKDTKNIHPNLLFPYKRKELTLREAIGHLPSLKKMGSFWDKDFLHNYKSFNLKMLPWIENLKEGQSAFENTEEHRIPHNIEDGVVVINANKNSDKYKRQKWDTIGPCVHTRNDTFSSQNTIHPVDNRVFSIRELMIMMSIPESFNWFDQAFDEINCMKNQEKIDLLKRNEMNIRQSIGESVSTKVFSDIAERYLELEKQLKGNEYSVADIENYFDIINKIFKGIKGENIGIKLLNPDILTLLILYSSASLFDNKKIYLDVISSSKSQVEKLDMPNHFNLKNGIEKGRLIMRWFDSKNYNSDLLFMNESSFENRILVVPYLSSNELKLKFAVKDTFDFKSLNFSVCLLDKANQLKIFHY